MIMFNILHVFNDLIQTSKCFCVLCLRSAPERSLIKTQCLPKLLCKLKDDGVWLFKGEDYPSVYVCLVCEARVSSALRVVELVEFGAMAQRLFGQYKDDHFHGIFDKIIHKSQQQRQHPLRRNVVMCSKQLERARAASNLAATAVLTIHLQEESPETLPAKREDEAGLNSCNVSEHEAAAVTTGLSGAKKSAKRLPKNGSSFLSSLVRKPLAPNTDTTKGPLVRDPLAPNTDTPKDVMPQTIALPAIPQNNTASPFQITPYISTGQMLALKSDNASDVLHPIYQKENDTNLYVPTLGVCIVGDQIVPYHFGSVFNAVMPPPINTLTQNNLQPGTDKNTPTPTDQNSLGNVPFPLGLIRSETETDLHEPEIVLPDSCPQTEDPLLMNDVEIKSECDEIEVETESITPKTYRRYYNTERNIKINTSFQLGKQSLDIKEALEQLRLMNYNKKPKVLLKRLLEKQAYNNPNMVIVNRKICLGRGEPVSVSVKVGPGNRGLETNRAVNRVGSRVTEEIAVSDSDDEDTPTKRIKLVQVSSGAACERGGAGAGARLAGHVDWEDKIPMELIAYAEKSESPEPPENTMNYLRMPPRRSETTSLLDQSRASDPSKATSLLVQSRAGYSSKKHIIQKNYNKATPPPPTNTKSYVRIAPRSSETAPLLFQSLKSGTSKATPLVQSRASNHSKATPLARIESCRSLREEVINLDDD